MIFEIRIPIYPSIEVEGSPGNKGRIRISGDDYTYNTEAVHITADLPLQIGTGTLIQDIWFTGRRPRFTIVDEFWSRDQQLDPYIQLANRAAVGAARAMAARAGEETK